MKRVWGMILLLAVLLSAVPGMAPGDVFTVDAQAAAEGARNERYVSASLTSDRSYLRVTCSLPGDAHVTLSIADEYGGLVYQRDHGVCSGKFRSEEIYLRLNASETTYYVTLWVNDESYSFPLRRVMPRLTGNAACSVGYPLTGLTGRDTWKSATILDVAALEGNSLTVPLHASGAYEIGTVTFCVEDGMLTVSAQLDPAVNGSIDKSAVYTATTALEAQALGEKNFFGSVSKLNKPIDLLDATYAAVYVNLTVSFDPANAPASPEVVLKHQDQLWERMLTETANEANG